MHLSYIFIAFFLFFFFLSYRQNGTLKKYIFNINNFKGQKLLATPKNGGKMIFFSFFITNMKICILQPQLVKSDLSLFSVN